MQSDPADLTLRIGLTLMLKWKEWYRESRQVTIDDVAGEMKFSIVPHTI